MSTYNNQERIGNITSSECYPLASIGSRLMTADEQAEYKKHNPKSQKKTIEDPNIFSQAALTYIYEKNLERKLGVPINNESKAKQLLWGLLLEGYANEHLGFEYELQSDITDTHPEIDYWTGSADLLKYSQNGKSGIADIKCPFTRKSFCQLVDPIYNGLIGIEAMNAIRFGYTDKNGTQIAAHKDGEKYYWQLVSNACIHNVDYVELIVFMPYKSELERIRADVNGDADYYWITFHDDDGLPFIPDDGYYKNINIIGFEVPLEDKIRLKNSIIRAGKLLYNTPSILTAQHDDEVGATIIEPSTKIDFSKLTKIK